MRPTVNLAVKGGGGTVVLALLKELSNNEVLIGVPAKTTNRKKGQKVTNAELVFIHTNGARVNASVAFYLHSKGSPEMRIPARPIIEPALMAAGNKERLQEDLKLAAQCALKGDQPGMIKYLNFAGMDGQNMARKWFDDPRNGWAPNAPSTIARKGSAKPLIDTGEMRKAITYVIRKMK